MRSYPVWGSFGPGGVPMRFPISDKLKNSIASVFLLVVAILVVWALISAPLALLLLPVAAGIYYGATRSDAAEGVAGFVMVPPIVLSYGAGAIFILIRCLDWLGKSTWPIITVQSLWTWPLHKADVSTGLLGLDKILWWAFASAPFELWLFVIGPALWLICFNVPAWAVRSWRQSNGHRNNPPNEGVPPQVD